MNDRPITIATRPGLGENTDERSSSVSDISQASGSREAVTADQELPGRPPVVGYTLPLGSRLPDSFVESLATSDRFPVPTPRVLPSAAGTPSRVLSAVSGARAHAPNPAPALPVASVPFRANALRAKAEEVAPESLPQITDGRWALLGFICSAVLLSTAAAYFGQVEVTSVAPGAVVVAGGPRPVLAQVSGVISELSVAAGEAVTAGQPIARVDATELEARKQRSAEQVERVRAENAGVDAQSAALLASSTAALQRKRALLVQRANLKSDAQAERKAQAGRLGLLAKEGAISQGEALSARELETSSRDELLVIRQQIADIDLELNDRQKAFDDQKLARSQVLNEALASLREVTALIETATVRAPVTGRVESLLVTRGQVAQPGVAFARIIPEGTLTSVVVFAPVRDASFLAQGLTAEVEFASLPVSEFGKAPARVSRVSRDVASAEETATVLGSELREPVIRVELELIHGATLARVESRLRSGERVTARLNTRKRRVITLIFDFLRKWYPS